MDGIENEGSSLTNSSGLMHSDFSEITKTCDSQDNGCEDSEYPINTKPLENQVAGHAFKDGKCTLGMLKHNDGYVLKPVNRPIQGEKEIKFYEELKKTVEPILLELKQFIPEYYGTTVLDLKGEKVTFLLLKDITNDFEEPCIMDIKVGKQTWEPGAPVEKQQSEQRKYAECKETLHFCIPGFQIYNIKTGLFQKYGKDFGKKLNPDGVYEVLKMFFNAEHGMSEDVILPILFQLKKILKWWKKQNVYHIYSSSILLAYDASILRKKICNKKNSETNYSFQNRTNLCTSDCEINLLDFKSELESWLCVYLIDFAHVVHAKDNTPDLNYISGLTSIIKVFENLLSVLRLKKCSHENKLQES